MKKIIWGVCLALIMAIGVARSATLTDDEQDKCTAGGRISCGNRT